MSSRYRNSFVKRVPELDISFVGNKKKRPDRCHEHRPGSPYQRRGRRSPSISSASNDNAALGVRHHLLTHRPQ